ncbi:nuclear transport factor 2 family protein [Haliea sp. E17]|uniref:nuclear transport factor 2 family protein n=1 Tax=Haliea sp. E17 TaxID=3401576 RepID=UPI003AAF900E
MQHQDAIVRSIETHCHALSNNDKCAWLEIWAEDAVIEDPVGVSTYRGVAEIGTALWSEIEAISPMKLWLMEAVIVCGNEAIAILAADVKSGSGRRRVGPIVDHFIFDNAAKISQMRAFWKVA